MSPRDALTVAALGFTLACGLGAGVGPPPRKVAEHRVPVIGVEPVRAIHLYENHSSALIAWRRAGVRDRVLVHIDGHSDLDWLPDAAIARLAAAESDELAGFELHPYTLDDTTHARFAIWNFVYPAVRLGIVRDYVWVVPDGTLAGNGGDDLVRGLIFGKMQGIGLDEARSLHRVGGVIRGRLLGVPTTICELSDLPEFDEPVLLDVDLDFLTTRSATSQEITERPWIDPPSLVRRLAARGLRTDLATVSYSTVGGYLPPACRWLGRAMTDALEGASEAATARAAAHAGATSWRELTERFPDEASAWYGLSLEEARAGRADAAEGARRRAITIDPVFEDAPLYEADGLWTNGRYGEALEAYRDYRRLRPLGPFGAYVLRREAGCLARLMRDDEAIEAFRRVVVAAPRHGDTRLDLGVLLRERGDEEGALDEMREARRLLPEQGSYAMALGMTLARQGRLDDALSEILDAVRLRPSWAHAQANAGGLLLEAGRETEALLHLDAAAFLSPGDPQVLRLLARASRTGGGARTVTRTAAP